MVISEKRFEMQVKQFLRSKGCWVLKTWSNGVQRDGVPDLLVCCNGYFLGVELKAQHGMPSELQKWNIDEIRKAAGIGIILYPDHFEAFKALVELLLKGGYYAAFKGQYKDFKRKEYHESE